MKIEVLESLACSYLRHVKRCWIVQANWKAPGDWARSQDIEALFSEMKQRFDRDGSVFKKTKDAGQFFKQGEIDVVGVDQQGGVHAMEAAFHEDGLNYKDTEKRVLKKMLRTLFILRTYHSPETRIHIYFLSPKVPRKVQKHLEITFDGLRGEYANVEWHLLINDDFTKSIIRPTLDNASAVADSSELFVRSVKLLKTARYWHNAPPVVVASAHPNAPRSKVQVQPLVPLVKALMRTLLVDHPSLLSEAEKSGLTDNAYCSKKKGLRIGFGLIRKKERGKDRRYWVGTYGDFYVCSQWSRYHCDNAQSLLAFVKDLTRRNPEHEDTLRPHAQDFCEYLARNCASPAP